MKDSGRIEERKMDTKETSTSTWSGGKHLKKSSITKSVA
jgi:hypothetical protein